MPKIEPAVTQLMYLLPNGVSYADIAKDLSQMNRRLYRQGMTYVVQDLQIGQTVGMTATDITRVTVSTIPNSWIAHNAWTKAFRAWRGQVRELTDHLGSGVEGKWADFKIYLDDSMEDGTILDPYAGDAAVFLAGEWDHSKLVFDDDGTEREFKMHMVGSTNLADTNEESAIGLIHEYQISRAMVNAEDPDTFTSLSDGIYAKMIGTDEMSDMLVDNLEDDNNNPPYDQDEYPGGHSNADVAHPARILSCNATQSTVQAPGFIVPCGLLKFDLNEIQLDSQNPAVYEAVASPTIICIVTVAAGPYRGVLAAPMGQ